MPKEKLSTRTGSLASQVWGGDSITHKILFVLSISFMIIGATTFFIFIDSNTISQPSQLSVILGGITLLFLDSLIKRKQTQQKIDKAEEELSKNPDKIKPFFDLANARLEKYFEINSRQIKFIFFATLIVISCGFSLIWIGISKGISADRFDAAAITSISGVLTEFVAATFFFMYKSTMSQANNYVKILEKITVTGIAVQLIESIPDSDVEIKNKAKADLAKLILTAANKNTSY